MGYLEAVNRPVTATVFRGWPTECRWEQVKLPPTFVEAVLPSLTLHSPREDGNGIDEGSCTTNVRVRVDEVDSDFPVTVPERSRAFAERSRYLSETSPVPAFHVDPLPAVSGSLNRPFTLPLTVNVAEPVRRFTTAEGGGEVGEAEGDGDGDSGVLDGAGPGEDPEHAAARIEAARAAAE